MGGRSGVAGMSHLITATTKRAGQARPQPSVQEVAMEHHNDYVADLLMSLPPSGEDAACVRCGDEADTRYLGFDWCESPCLIDVLAPLAVVCISCDAGPGISCVTNSGQLRTPHQPRRDLSVDPDCPRCGAPATHPCRKYAGPNAGAVASQMHAARIHLVLQGAAV